MKAIKKLSFILLSLIKEGYIQSKIRIQMTSLHKVIPASNNMVYCCLNFTRHTLMLAFFSSGTAKRKHHLYLSHHLSLHQISPVCLLCVVFLILRWWERRK